MNRKRIEKILHNCSKTIDVSVNRVGASNEIFKYIEDLEQQVEKQKEAINKAIEYIRNHQLVFKDATLKETEDWFNQFYIDLLDILKEVE